MMKLSTTICILYLLLASVQAHASSNPFASLYYEKVMVCKGYDQVTIYNEVINYFNDRGIAAVNQGSMDHVVAKGGFKVCHNIISVVKNPVGEVSFDIRIDIKDEKFRMVLYNIWFQSFERDRYGKLVLSDAPELVSPEGFKRRPSLLEKIEKQIQTYIDDTGKVISEEIINKEFEITDW